MGKRIKDEGGINGENARQLPGKVERATRHADQYGAYHLARAHVIEASIYGLVRQRVA
jgi:hypothetical protein